MIDISQDRFPFCLVWTTLPCLSWLLPWIGHVGICDSSGIIYDFLGHHINKKRMAFGRPKKYVQLKECDIDEYNQSLNLGNKHYESMAHDLCCNNCHHHVAHILNLLRYQNYENWTQFSIWWMCLFNSHYTSYTAILCTYFPFIILVSIIVLLIALL